MRRDLALIALLATIVGVGMALMIRQPGFTDAYYYFNAGQRLAAGFGLTDAALWTYIGDPPGLPAPSHLYWMPLASLLQALFMTVFGPTFRAAQIPMVACFIGMVVLAYWIGLKLSNARRIGWIAGLLTLCSGFYMPYWVQTDTFSLYGLIGAACLASIGLVRESNRLQWVIAAGALAGLAHLTRADGILFLLVLIIVTIWPPSNSQSAADSPSLSAERSVGGEGKRIAFAILAYLLVMAPWFARNLLTIGSIMPVGGVQVAFMRGYEEIVNYPPGVSIAEFLSWGLGNILGSRWEAFAAPNGTFWTFLAVETSIILAPFLILALWKRRHHPFLTGVILYAVGLHLLMTLVFPLAGARGGLFHSAAALLPFWAALGTLGLDDAVRWAARKRRWPLKQARTVFSTVLIIFAACLSLLLFVPGAARFNTEGALYRKLGEKLPKNAVVLINDPPAFYYHTGRAGTVLPNAPVSMIPTLVARFGITHLVIDVNRTVPFDPIYLYTGSSESLPPFLHSIWRGEQPDGSHVEIFEIVLR